MTTMRPRTLTLLCASLVLAPPVAGETPASNPAPVAVAKAAAPPISSFSVGPAGDIKAATVTANSFSGSGAGLTALDPAAISAGTAPISITGNAHTVDGYHASAFQRHWDAVKVVAKSGGDYASIQDAIDSIGDADSDRHYLIRVMPGIYSEQVKMQQYVDIECAGELVTKITSTGFDDSTTGTVIGADDAELRFCTVENTGGAAWAIAIHNDGVSPRLTHVTALASGSDANVAVDNSDASPRMVFVTAEAWSGDSASGVDNTGSATPEMIHVTALGRDATTTYGIANTASSPVIADSSATASGGTFRSYGIFNSGASPTIANTVAVGKDNTAGNCGMQSYGSTVTLTESTVTATGGSSAQATWSVDSNLTIRRSTIVATGGSSENVGIDTAVYTETPASITVDNSQVEGATATVRAYGPVTVQVGATKLDGGSVSPSSGAAVVCAGVFTGAYAFHASTCP